MARDRRKEDPSRHVARHVAKAKYSAHRGRLAVVLCDLLLVPMPTTRRILSMITPINLDRWDF